MEAGFAIGEQTRKAPLLKSSGSSRIPPSLNLAENPLIAAMHIRRLGPTLPTPTLLTRTPDPSDLVADGAIQRVSQRIRTLTR